MLQNDFEPPKASQHYPRKVPQPQEIRQPKRSMQMALSRIEKNEETSRLVAGPIKLTAESWSVPIKAPHTSRKREPWQQKPKQRITENDVAANAADDHSES